MAVNWKVIEPSHAEQFYVGGAIVDDMAWDWDHPELTCIINHEGDHTKDWADLHDNNSTAKKIYQVDKALFVIWSEINSYLDEILDPDVSFNYYYSTCSGLYLWENYNKTVNNVGGPKDANFSLVQPRLEDSYKKMPGYFKQVLKFEWHP